jgi:hypothetical protein
VFQSTLEVDFAYVVRVAALGLTTVQAQNSPVKNVVLVSWRLGRRLWLERCL